MAAWLRLPRSSHPTWLYPLEGYTSLENLQQESFNRHKRDHPPRAFDPAWLIEPTICNLIPNGVELHKWSICKEQWVLDAVLTWKEEP